MTLATQRADNRVPSGGPGAVADQTTLDDPANVFDAYCCVNRNPPESARVLSSTCSRCRCVNDSPLCTTDRGGYDRNILRTGCLLAGRLRIQKVIGSGGMGLILAAHHIHLDQRVAIKVLRPDAVRRKGGIERFLGEARAAAKIDSPHIARVLDANTFECGLTFLVMEYLDGVDLEDWVARKGPLTVPQAAEFMLQACEALALAHAIGIVHRDIKPSNLFCCFLPNGTECIKVIDFGISTMSGSGGSDSVNDYKRSSSIMGSPQYMSPEQLKSPNLVDARTDIWSLGVTLFQLLTGQLPFGGNSLSELATAINTLPMPSLRAYRADVPPGLQSVVEQCLTKDKECRYQNIGELANALWPFAPTRTRVHVERIRGALVHKPRALRQRAVSLVRTRNFRFWHWLRTVWQSTIWRLLGWFSR